jgi:delta24(24(1))-sterol reductase
MKLSEINSNPDELSNNAPTNGHANGNGYTNGHANTKAEQVAYDYEIEAKKNFAPRDASGTSEFGGAIGMSAMMVGFPALMYYMWIGATFYDGKFPKPTEGQDYKQFSEHMWGLVKTEAYPSERAWRIYWFFGLVQMAFYMLMPGVYRKGKPLPHLNGKQLDYYCSAMWSFYSSVVLALVLHYTGVFKLYTLVDQFGPIMSVAILSGYLCSVIAYVSALVRGARVRITGSPIVDFFLGSELNPRLFGILDFKMFLEVRIPWFILFFLSLGTCLRQYEQYGYVSMEAVFLLFAHYLYVGACAKGEHLIITTW